MTESSWTVYVLRCGDGSLYTGIARDAQARLAQHREGKGARYTRGRGPLALVYAETVSGRSEALKREVQIKRLSRPEKEQLIADFVGD